MQRNNPPRISPDCSEAFRELRIMRFKRYWSCPKQMTMRPYLSVWTLDVKTYDDFLCALDSAHALKCVNTLFASYTDGKYEGSCVVPNSDLDLDFDNITPNK